MVKTARRVCASAFLGVALLLPAILPGSPALAQVDASNPEQQKHHGYRRPNLDDVVIGLAKNLDLNEAQQSVVKRILEQRQQETLRIRLDQTIPATDRIDRLRALQENTVTRIRAVLNEEQRKKYDPLAAKRIQPAPSDRSVEDWLKVAH